MASIVAADRNITVKNACPYTVWPAIYTSLGAQPSQPNGWVAPANTSVTFTVPDLWVSIHWPVLYQTEAKLNRTVAFGDAATVISLSTLGQTRALLADAPEASCARALFIFNSASPQDYYDISLIVGYNVPMRIDNHAACGNPSCPVNLNPSCPTAQKGPFDPTTGAALGCTSACELDKAHGLGANSTNCCTGMYNTPSTCPSSNVTNYNYYKSNCVNTYAYPFDESSGTASWTCSTLQKAAYTITFCPSS
ncbi:Thaumatin-like protein [Mycena sanguinolenta]|uniref:Thaumatin-like protein n=1 Tax=Mycena sanguinolenta TaxID=230812 RepID=A0A8H6YRD8_9AGAR|nr:Thaumatin-like protein [Mycena sanguinolenta]